MKDRVKYKDRQNIITSFIIFTAAHIIWMPLCVIGLQAYAQTHSSMYANIQTIIHTKRHTFKRINTHIHTNTDTHAHTPRHKQIHKQTHAHTCTDKRYTHTYKNLGLSLPNRKLACFVIFKRFSAIFVDFSVIFSYFM